MDLKGQIVYRARDFKTGKILLTMSVDEIPPGVDKLPEGDLQISLKPYRRSRSLNANSYYWVLIGKIADAVQHSRFYVHNWMLRDYGPMKFIDGLPMTVIMPDTDAARDQIDNDQYQHLLPTSHTQSKGDKVFRAYYVLKGSSEYDTREMARLIEGTINEAKELGIETLSAEELERMLA